jgi:hypothetical protein
MTVDAAADLLSKVRGRLMGDRWVMGDYQGVAFKQAQP